MLPTGGSIFVPLKVASITIDNNFKGPLIEKPPKCQSFKIAILVPRILTGLQYTV